MTPTDESRDSLSALLAPLRERTRDHLDDVTAARVLARAEAALPPSAFDEPITTAPPWPSSRARPRRWLVPATLMVWGAIYVWAAVGAIRLVYPSAQTANREVAALAAAHVGSSALLRR
jgi:hypothetical protein